MALLPILHAPDPRLRKKTPPVTVFDQKLQTLIDDMFETMYDAPGVGLAAGEFQIYSPNNAMLRANEVAGLMFSAYQQLVLNYGPGTKVDLTPFVSLASNPQALVDALDLTLTRGVMPGDMKQSLVNAINADGSGNVHRVQAAAYLILTSSYYNVWQ